ncbi:MAG: 2-amino-3,7-dideoxy-D-threo-hept-6-ulosonate synthase [Thermoplasmatota archaeon]
MSANPLRMSRLCNAAGTFLMVPMDHGVSMGPAAGIENPARLLATIAPTAATCVTTHKGLTRLAAEHGRDLGVLMHLSASTDANPDPNDKRLVATVAEAARAGCDGVSIHVNVGATTESRMIADAGAVATACDDHGMPLVAMMYPRGPHVTDPFDARLVAHAARLGAELGADVVKCPYTGDPESFRDVVDGCPVPVIISGGPKQPDLESFLAAVEGAASAGARGVSVGRNVFQHPKPEEAMAGIAARFP